MAFVHCVLGGGRAITSAPGCIHTYMSAPLHTAAKLTVARGMRLGRAPKLRQSCALSGGNGKTGNKVNQQEKTGEGQEQLKLP